MQRAGADLHLLGRVVLDQRAGVDPSHELVVEAQDAVEAQDVRDEVVREKGERRQVVAAGQALEAQIGGGVPIVSASVAPTLPPTVDVLVAGATQ